MELNAEQEKLLILARARKRAAEAEQNQGNTAFLNRGIADVLGGPVDGVNWLMDKAGMPMSDEPFLGSENIARGMRAVGVRVADGDDEPDTFGEHVSKGIGEAAGFVLPGIAAAKALEKGAGVIGGVSRAMIEPLVRSPKTMMAAEVTSGAGAGTGRAIADELAEGSEAARVAGEIIGGLAGGFGPGAAVSTTRSAINKTPLVGTAIRAGKKAVVPFTEAGAKERARDRIRDLAEDPEAAAANLAEERNIGGLSPAQQTGDERLMALERVVRDTDPPVDLAMRHQEMDAAETLRQIAREPAAKASIEDTQEFISKRLGEVLSRMDKRIKVATKQAQVRISALEPTRRATEASIIVRDELKKAFARARKAEAQLWGLVPKSATASTKATKEAYRSVLAETPRAQLEDIPDVARRLLDPDASNQAFGDAESIRELHGLYSKLREFSRKAIAEGSRNSSRIADELADALLVDMGAAGVDTETAVGRSINDARSYTAALNEKFRQGSIGKVLGRTRDGSDAVPPELTLDTTVGRSGIRGAISAQEIREAAAGSEDAEAGIRAYLQRRFQDTAVREGELNPKRAHDFVRNNDELLDLFPDLRAQMRDATQAQGEATSATNRIERRANALRDPRKSKAAQFLNAPVDQEIQTVIKSRDPGKAAAELRRQASKDKTGDAVRGLKGGFVDFVMDRARTGQFDDAGEAFVSGSAIQGALKDKRVLAVAKEVLDPQDLLRLRQVAVEFKKMEKARGRLPAVGAVMDQEPNRVISFLAGTWAARAGSKLGAGTSGASLRTASAATGRMQRIMESLTNDRAEALMREAITGDRDLFRVLLSKPSAVTDKSVSKVTAVLTAMTGNQIGDTDNR